MAVMTTVADVANALGEALQQLDEQVADNADLIGQLVSRVSEIEDGDATIDELMSRVDELEACGHDEDEIAQQVDRCVEDAVERKGDDLLYDLSQQLQDMIAKEVALRVQLVEQERMAREQARSIKARLRRAWKRIIVRGRQLQQRMLQRRIG